MSHNAAPVKGPAPPVEVMTLWERVKRLGTLLTTEEEKSPSFALGFFGCMIEEGVR